jgi:hypothetical protein
VKRWVSVVNQPLFRGKFSGGCIIRVESLLGDDIC